MQCVSMKSLVIQVTGSRLSRAMEKQSTVSKEGLKNILRKVRVKFEQREPEYVSAIQNQTWRFEPFPAWGKHAAPHHPKVALHWPLSHIPAAAFSWVCCCCFAISWQQTSRKMCFIVKLATFNNWNLKVESAQAQADA